MSNFEITAMSAAALIRVNTIHVCELMSDQFSNTCMSFQNEGLKGHMSFQVRTRCTSA